VLRVHHGRGDEILGVYETEEAARSHAQRADRAGETTLRQQKIHR
jgi:ATP-dependent Clp protease adapter protein ClpS